MDIPSEGTTAGRWTPSWGVPTLPVHGMDLGWPASGSLISKMLCLWTKGWKALGTLEVTWTAQALSEGAPHRPPHLPEFPVTGKAAAIALRWSVLIHVYL